MNALVGNNGIITKAQESSFRTEMTSVKEAVEITNAANAGAILSDSIKKEYEPVPLEDTDSWKLSLKMEIINWKNTEIVVNQLSTAYVKKQFKEILKDGDYVKGLYYVKEDNFDEKKYLYDEEGDIVYKILPTHIGMHTVHSIEELDYLKTGEKRTSIRESYSSISQNAEIKQIGNLKYYEPDLNGLVKEVTSLIFYEKVNGNITTTEHPVTAEQWISNGRPNELTENGHTYVLYDYENNIWANIRLKTSGIETNWTWIPRYKFSNSGTSTSIAFVDVSDNVLNNEQGEFTALKAFEGNTKKGMWTSKYEPSFNGGANKTTYPYYIPDISGLAKNKTELAIYDENAENFVEYIPLNTIRNISKFSEDNNWFDYYNKKWANIRVKENGIETWWVWIPRYAYKNEGTSTDVIFIDTDDKPIDGPDLSSAYEIPKAFKGNKKRGMWVSKYEVSEKIQDTLEEIATVPDLNGFDTSKMPNAKVYLEIYNDAKTAFVEQVELSTISDLSLFAKEHNWYSYSNNAWANIKVEYTKPNTNEKVETWWVWIPRYAFRNIGTGTEILLIGTDNKTLKSKAIPDSYTIAEAFKNNTKSGIWVSKYEVSEKTLSN